MGTSLHDLRRWFDDGVRGEHAHMIVVCDSFDHEDYPIYTDDATHFWEQYDSHDDKNMQRIMEVYDLSRPWSDDQKRQWQMPDRPAEGKSDASKT